MKAFNGDHFIKAELEKLVHLHSIESIIETGTWAGDTTRELRKMVPGRVVTIDISHQAMIDTYGPDAVSDLAALGIDALIGDSGEMLGDVIDDTPLPILFYLDAHGTANPLLDELDHIAKLAPGSVIAIHDFMTNDGALGYNTGVFGGREWPLCMALIEDRLNEIYKRGWRHHFNDRRNAAGALRGVVYIYPDNG